MAIAFIRRSRLSFSCADGHHDYQWGGTADIHQQCVICDAIVDGSAHTYKVKYTWQDNHENGCTAENSCECGYVKNTETSSDVSTTTHAATCTEDEWYTCTAKFSTLGSAVCGAQHVIEGTATGHDPSDYTYDTAAHWKNCNTCGIQLDYATHTSVTDSGYDATCTEDGLTDGSHCSVCDMVITAQETIDATGHDWGGWIIDKESTEYDEGSKHRVCGTCGEEETATIPTIGHTHTSGNAVRENEIAATCTTPGSYDLVTRCTGCNEILTSESKTIAATGHDWDEWIVDKEATETAEGSRHRECANCDEIETETIPKTDHVHVEGEAKEENRVAATCETDGRYDLVVRCTGCGNILSSETKTIPATGHTNGDAVVENRVEATCTTEGSYDTVVYCTTCDTELSRVAHEIAVKAHTPGAAATCTTDQTCTVCQTVLKAATGHTEVIDEAVEATCTSTGLTVGKHCSVCNTVLIAQQTVPEKGHTASEPVEEDRKEPTCTTDGSYNEVTYCSVCTVKMGSVLVTIPSPGHDDSNNSDNVCDICGAVLCTDNNHVLVTIPGKAATCTSTGLTDGEKCSACGKIITTQQVIDKLEHDYSIVVKNGLAATCVSDGYTDTLKCSMCGDVKASQTIGAFGHDWESGEYPCTCERCGLHDPEYDTDESPGECIHCGLACKHDFSNLITDEVSPTCTEAGYTAVYECGHCGIRDGGDKLEALGHIYDESAPEEDICLCTRCGQYTHTTEGEKCECIDCGAHVYIDTDGDYRCDICGESICDEHDWVTSEEAKDPTCTEPGYTLSEYCGNCGETRGGEAVGKPLGHSYSSETGTCVVCNAPCNHVEDNGVIEDITEPTCGTAGSQTVVYKCTICGMTTQSYDEVLPATNKHQGGETVIENYVAPTCTSYGSYDEVVYCKVCNVELERHENHSEEPIGHDWEVKEEGYAATCTEPGMYTSYFCGNCGESKGGGTIPDTGHSAGAEVTENENEASCEENGGYDTVQYCTVCGEEINRTHTTIYATGHLEGESVIENSYESSCTEKGSYDTVWYCQYCGTELQRTTETLELAPHTLVTVKENEQEADCTSWGSYEAVVKCSVCGAESERHTEYTDEPLGHDYIGDMNEIAPTCEENGKAETQTCTRCHDVIGGETIPATGHTHDSGTSTTVESTCTTKGYTLTVWKCVNCGITLEESKDELELAPHDLTTVIENEVAATCTSPGSYDEVVKCSVCGAESERHTSYTDKLDHDYIGDMNEVAATCTTDGKEETQTCTKCGDVIGGDTIPKLGHTGGEYVKEIITEATCQTLGSYTEAQYCTVCGTELDRTTESYYEDPDNHTAPDGCQCEDCGATWHNYEPNDDAIEPTCGEEGRTASRTCTECGATIAGTSIEATGEHEYDMLECTCINCGDHNDSYIDDDCYCSGCDEYFHQCTRYECTCEHCGATDHVFVNGVCKYGCGTTDPNYEPDACLIASTPILMADGSEKAISQVRAGDMVKSWDIENNEYIDVKVLGAYCTGTEQDWSVHTFDNGRTLDISNEHRIFCKEKNSVRQSTDWRAGNTAISLDGAETKYYDMDVRHDDHATNRYTMLTENNLYFANGILCGHHAKSKYKFVNRGWLEATPEELEQYRITAALYDELDKAFTNEEYLKEAAPLREQLLKAKEDIRLNRHEISKLERGMDKQKRSKLSRKDQDAFDNKRNSYRSNARSIKDNNKAVRAQLDELKTKFGITTKSKYQIWKEAYDLDMNYIKNRSAK